MLVLRAHTESFGLYAHRYMHVLRAASTGLYTCYFMSGDLTRLCLYLYFGKLFAYLSRLVSSSSLPFYGLVSFRPRTQQRLF